MSVSFSSVSFAPAVAALLHQPLTAAVVTLNADGTPQLTYIWYEFDGSTFRMSTTSGRLKAHNIKRDPRIGLSVLDPSNPYRFVSMKGHAAISTEGGVDLILRLAIRYQGPERGETYGRQMQSPDRVVVTFEPTSLYVNGF